MRYVKIYLFALILLNSSILDAQEATSDGEAPSTVQQLLIREPFPLGKTLSADVS